jgi:prevent-host-death family protein
MRSVNALELRQSLGRVLRQLERGGAPILVQRGRQPAAVLISLHDYQERFAERDADERRRDVVAQIKAAKFAAPRRRTTLDLLRDLRTGRQ